jgi:NAD(P)-dependent dehydrogenase (short-subunit alcohol dehydrogenase family)
MKKKIKNNNCALITGGAKRIGREMALTLASRGFDIIISYNKSQKEAQKLIDEISKKHQVKCAIFQSDLTKIDEAKKLINFVEKNFKHCNLLINNASIFKQSTFLSGDEKELMDNLNIHFLSPLILSKTFAKFAGKNAQIINMIDKNIVRFDTSYFYYLLSKKALAELTKMLALQLAPEIRVNAIAPGFILNPIDEGLSAQQAEKIIKKIPLSKKGDAKNITQALEFLLDNDFVNGQIISIDGGASLNHAG